MSCSPGRTGALLLAAAFIAAPGLRAASDAPALDSRSAPSLPRPTAEATVSGRVVDARTGAAIAGARVACGGRAATSADNGSFRLGVPRGRAALEVAAAGYAPKTVVVVAGDGPKSPWPSPPSSASRSGWTSKRPR